MDRLVLKLMTASVLAIDQTTSRAAWLEGDINVVHCLDISDDVGDKERQFM